MAKPRLFLCIGRQLYSLCRVGTSPTVWRLRKLRRGGEIEAVYDIHNAEGEFLCDCGTMMRPGRTCKHKRILRDEGIIS